MEGDLLVPTGVPLALTSRERNTRMDEIADGKYKAQIGFNQSLPKSDEKPEKVAIKRAYKRRAKPTQVVLSPAVDLTQFTPQQIEQIKEQLNGHGSRIANRMKEAIVFTSIAEMLDEMPADQVLLMVTQMRRLPSVSRR